MGLLLNFVAFIGVLGVLVVVHELGHFVTAKRAGVRVLEFGIGYPPRLFAFRRGDTEYSLNILPLGGFVRMVGEEDPTEPGSLASKSIPWRFAVLSAGVIMNGVLAVALLAFSALLPHTEPVGQIVIQGVRTGSPAEAAGIKQDDVVVSVNGRTIRNALDLQYNVNLNLGNQVTIVVARDGKEIETRVVPRIAPPPGEGATGVEIGWANPVWRYRKDRGMSNEQLAEKADVPVEVAKAWVSGGSAAVGKTKLEQDIASQQGIGADELRTRELDKLAGILGVPLDKLTETYVRPEQVSASPFEAVQIGFRRTGEMVVLFKNDVVGMIARRQPPQVAGPVGIYQLTGEVAQQATQSGISILLDLAALLSINLAVLNALPIPMLDGGRIMFVLIEAVRGGRRISPDKEKFAHLVGAAVLLTLVVAVTFQDIVRLATGESVFR